MPSRTPFYPLAKRFIEMDPISAIQVLETMSQSEAVSILKQLPIPLLSALFPRLQAGYASQLIREMPADFLKEVVEHIDPQQGAVIFLAMDDEQRRKFIESLSEKTKKLIQDYLVFPEDSVGRIMTTDFIAFRTEVHVREAVQKIRTLAKSKGAVSYVYVLDFSDHLVGVMYMRDLLLASGDETLGSLMRKDLFTVDSFLTQEEVANELTKRKFFAAPVVDKEGKLLGVVKSDQLMDFIQSEVSEDIVKMFGAGEDEKSFSSMTFSLQKRIPWLYVNLATAFLAASVVSLFEDIIAKITVLAVFLPVVAGQGGNAGAQSLAVVMRGLVLREIPSSKYKKMVIKESIIGVLNGVFVGIVTSLVAWIWKGNMSLGIVIGLAMIVNLTVAGLFGATIPLMLKAMGRDPAQSSSILLTTVTDVIGFLSFLGFAVLFQNKLM